LHNFHRERQSFSIILRSSALIEPELLENLYLGVYLHELILLFSCNDQFFRKLFRAPKFRVDASVKLLILDMKIKSVSYNVRVNLDYSNVIVNAFLVISIYIYIYIGFGFGK
jgi:hypothetical protein